MAEKSWDSTTSATGPVEASLRQTFETWLQKVVLPRLGLSQEEVSAAETLEELETMLADSIDRWNREIREKALQEGLGSERILTAESLQDIFRD